MGSNEGSVAATGQRRRVNYRSARPATPLSIITPRPLDIPVVIILAVVFLLIGGAGGLSAHPLITVNGAPAVVSRGTTGTQIAEGSGFNPRRGAKMDLVGDVRSPGQAGAGKVTVNGSDDLDRPLVEGDQVVEVSGTPELERVEKRTEEIPFEVESEGSGSVMTLVQKGEPGERVSLVGVSSQRTGATLISKAPVNSLVRYSPGVGSGQKVVALTFDDGPGDATEAILQILAEKGVKATFFVLGQCAAEMPELIQKERSAGHEIENHTWNHPDLATLSADQIRDQITRTSPLIGGSDYLRPPYGSYNSTVTQVAGSLGIRLVLWDVDTRDWESRNADAIVEQVKVQIRPGAIILMHDGGGDRAATVAALPRVIDWLFDQGYAFATVRQIVN